MKKTSENKVKEVLHYAKKGMSVRAVARKTGLHYSTISRICNSKIPERQKNRGGRKALITSETKRRISRLVQSGAMDTAVQVHAHLVNTQNFTGSAQTVRNALRENGLRGRVKKKKSALSALHRKNRLLFAQTHKDWSLED